MKVSSESYNLEKELGTDNLLLILGEQDPIFFANEILGVKLNPFNERFLIALCIHKQILVVTANQVGKTVTLAVAHIWWNFYKKGLIGDPKLIEKSRYETLNLSPVSRQAKECSRYVDEILHSNFSWEINKERFVNKCKIKWFFSGSNENLGRISFSNNSFFWCVSTGQDQGSGIAGKQFPFISYDECVQSHHLSEELDARIFSRTAKYSGTIALISTPDELAKSQQYWFHLYIRASRARDGEGESDWFLITGLYDENIFIPEETREDFKKRLKKQNPLKYRQVIEGDFVASATLMFSPQVVEGLWNKKRDKTEPMTGHRYVILVDWGVADQGDETVMLVTDITDLLNAEIIFAYSRQGGDPVELMAMASFLKMQYNGADLVMDTASLGGVIFRKMLLPLKPISFGKELKPDALTYLQLRLRNNIRKKGEKNLTNIKCSDTGKIKSYYLSKMETQLSSYKIEDRKIKQDWVMVIAQLAWYLEKYIKGSQVKTFPLNYLKRK